MSYGLNDASFDKFLQPQWWVGPCPHFQRAHLRLTLLAPGTMFGDGGTSSCPPPTSKGGFIASTTHSEPPVILSQQWLFELGRPPDIIPTLKMKKWRPKRVNDLPKFTLTLARVVQTGFKLRGGGGVPSQFLLSDSATPSE